MKITCLILFVVIIAFAFNTAFAYNREQGVSLSGKITDKATGDPLPGVILFFPDLKIGATTTNDGTYRVDNLPASKALLQITFIGYKTIVSTIDLSTVTTKDFVLEESVTEIREVVITGTSRATEVKRDPVPILIVKRADIDQDLSTNIIDAIANEPGVNAVTTGPNVSKPFIRGLGYNRVLTLYDGVRQEGQQWGDEHGIEVDENAIDRVEVVKGPASLTYGSDALAGVVNLLPPTPVQIGTIRGMLGTDYQTNNNLINTTGAIDGNTHGLVWGGRLSHKQSEDYQDPIDGRVYGTNFNETDGSGYIGVNRSWGYLHLSAQVFDDLQAIPDGSRDSLTRQFTKQISEIDTFRPVVSSQDLHTYKIPVLHQHVQHYRLISSNSINMGSGTLDITLGAQENIRREFSHPDYPDLAGLYLLLHSYTYDIKYHLAEMKGWATTVGVNGMYQINKNDGTDFIIPDYNEFDMGPFVHTQKTFGKLDVSGGIRYDTRYFKNNAMYVAPDPVTGFDMQVHSPDTTGATRTFSNYQQTFSGGSGSFGATYNFSDNFLIKANIARGFRAPNISEISANGVHPGTNIYQLGNPDFKPEFSLQEDIGIMFSYSHVSGGIEVFNNDIQNYIFDEKVLSKTGGDSIIVPGNQTFQFQASNAELYGGEANLDFHPHPLDWLHFENSLSVVYALNRGTAAIPVSDSAKYLPDIPPPHTKSELRANIKKKLTHFSALYFKVSMEWYARQNRAYIEDNTETPTPGYTLFNAGLGGNITDHQGKILFSIHISGNNITDVAYQSALSRLKYMEEYSASPNGHLGIYNMGRNIGFKVIVPIDFKK